MATELCMAHPPAASAHFSSSLFLFFLNVRSWLEIALWLIHCFSTCSNSVPDLLLFLVPLHSGLLSYLSQANKQSSSLSFCRTYHLYTHVCTRAMSFMIMLIDLYHSKQYQAISRKEATVQVPLSTRTVFSLDNHDHDHDHRVHYVPHSCIFNSCHGPSAPWFIWRNAEAKQQSSTCSINVW